MANTMLLWLGEKEAGLLDGGGLIKCLHFWSVSKNSNLSLI
jgi:hypothetical protein